ncbi:hypothetical protein [Rhodovibrio salinarum]|uniref:Uncharacterized protein n=1 Tax=Rhodovibrio salinarum TaxID=1087 RepID=A0A934UZ99_9PROT|nr:hypothetical protein [Rhodovibrio salinarum]MBK1696972.1 hypothetical protein [Rhodovibrio salinarum]
MSGNLIELDGRCAACGDEQAEVWVKARSVAPCYAIMAVSGDFQDLIRAECPRCQTGTGSCLVARLRALAAGSETT